MSNLLFRSLMSKLLKFVQRHGFLIVLFVVIVYFSFSAQYFLNSGNILAILHATAPLLIVASGLSIVVLTGKIDISVGSIAFLSTVIGMKLLYNMGIPSWLSFFSMLLIGCAIGALNAAMIVYLQVSPLVTTLASMIALRGVALTLTGSMSMTLPENIRLMGNAKIGPIFVDVLVAFFVMLLVHGVITRTTFGRQVIAVGNDDETAARVGINVTRVTFLSFVLSGFLASLSGALTMVQVGSITSFLGQGLEFTAVAVVVIGGISLYGGSGSVFPGVLLGAVTLEVVRNGLNQVGADPYFYKIITGLVIFVAIYAFSLKRFVGTQKSSTSDSKSAKA